MTDVTPESLRELAERAAVLAADIRAVKAAMWAADDEPTQRVGFRLDTAASEAVGVGREIIETAEDLARVRARSACPADWGVCPEHGATLRGSGGRSWCSTADCGREWDFDRGGLPCTEPVAFEVRSNTNGEITQMCAGHARNAAERLIGGATLVRLESGSRS